MKLLSTFLAVFLITSLAFAKPLEDEQLSKECDLWMPICCQEISTGEIRIFPNQCELILAKVFGEGDFKEIDLTVCFEHKDFNLFLDKMVADAESQTVAV